MQHAWEQGARFGAVEATQRDHARRLDLGDAERKELRREVDLLRSHFLRAGLLILLAMGAVGLNLGAKDLGEFTGTTLKSLMR